ncbi:hypothetical protein K3725_02355 [Leisingera sp. S132]|uniref:hypothetical protein n=1 Tax=Leisingera sp. S132 TaxID=2867016 RepID=UPI0021A5C935|nr:hypothetical protein [Leisingera sp. S132]UWQ79871.1 hypothetical protein K3725_02355 [Leisingera sp. S132]
MDFAILDGSFLSCDGSRMCGISAIGRKFSGRPGAGQTPCFPGLNPTGGMKHFTLLGAAGVTQQGNDEGLCQSSNCRFATDFGHDVQGEIHRPGLAAG